jgi:hypothetical protein
LLPRKFCNEKRTDGHDGKHKKLISQICPGAVNLPGDEQTFECIIPTPEKARAPGQ